jgi:hypothetical protein
MRPDALTGGLLNSQQHKPLQFFVQVLGPHHPEMVVELVGTRHLRDLVEAEIVFVWSLKRENNIHEIFAQPGYPGDPRGGGDGDHGFGWVYSNGCDLSVFRYKMPEQSNRMRRFAGQEIGQEFFVAGMLLVIVFEWLVAKRAGPHGILLISKHTRIGNRHKA